MHPDPDIDYGLLNMVDLDIAYSPVIPYAGSPLCEAIKLPNGYYLVIYDHNNPAASAQKVHEEELRVMRLRYLLREGERKTLALNSWLRREA